MNEEVVKLTPEEEVVIEVTEAIGWATGNAHTHNSLPDRNIADQHTIEAITGLRAELDGLEKLDTVYSDKANMATYYKWNGQAPANRIGYFVTLVPHTYEIAICGANSDIFGVTVDNAGFIGRQSDVELRDNYDLVVMSGLVNVKCNTSVVKPGDYVISGDDGAAMKTNTKFGYKVIDTNHEEGYALIMMGVQADTTHYLERSIELLQAQLDAANTNIKNNGKLATEAWSAAKNSTTDSSSAKDEVDEIKKDVEDIKGSVDTAVKDSSSAKEIASDSAIRANDAMNYAEQKCKEAIDTANDSWAKSQGLAEDEYSLRTNVDMYGVGEYSQAYGLTIDQATKILKLNTIYVPTHFEGSEYGDHTETYYYSSTIESEMPTKEADRNKSVVYYKDETYYYYDGSWKESNEIPTVSRKFYLGRYYRWQELPSGIYGWYSLGELSYGVVEPETISEGDEYWYTNGEEIKDSDGNASDYKPYALYKWEKPVGEDSYRWVLKATRSGNALNRTIGITNLTATNASFEVANSRESIASIDARLTETESRIDNVVKWTTVDGSHNLGVTTLKADDNGSEMVLSVKNVENNDVTTYAGVVLKQDGENSYVAIDANQILLDGQTIVKNTTGETKIDGGLIETEGLVIGGWNVDRSRLYHETNDAVDMFFCPQPTQETTMNDGADKLITLKVGEKFSVTNKGELYCSDAHITGKLSAKNNEEEYKLLPIDAEIYFDGRSEVSDHSVIWGGYTLQTKTVASPSLLNKGDYKQYPGQQDVNISSVITYGAKTSESGYTSIYSPHSYITIAAQGARVTRYSTDTDGTPLLGYQSCETSIKLTDQNGQLNGVWNLNDDVITTVAMQTDSDINKKHNIKIMPDSYDVLFDNLKPVVYQYNNGTSDRYHAGFIAQEVKDAMDTAGLDMKDFAAICISDKDTNDETWRLRYNEFISINTHQIQKLKERVLELEDAIRRLQGE